jgi:hypothetical protein
MPDNQQQSMGNKITGKSFLQMIVPAALLCCIVAFLWPYFQYYIDPDAISYLNITAKYVEGDYQHAVNAFWSPMGCWLTAVLVKCTHWPLFKSAIIINTIPAVGMVFAGQTLFHKFRHNDWERWCFGLMSAIFWSYTVYFQSFTDIWQFFFLTVGVLILLREKFTSKPLWWIILGIMGCLAFFGKAYSFVFFPVMILVVTAIKLHSEKGFKIKRWLIISLTSIIVMMLCLSPWVYLLHEKYGIWTYSTAGKLNMSWWLVGTQEFKESVHAVVPPPYKGSLYYFEDPYLAQGKFSNFWQSPHLFLKQIMRTLYNIVGWTESSNRISAFYFVVWVLSILFFVQKRKTIFESASLKIILTLFIIFPLPYWLLTFDHGRYLWFTIPLASILAMTMSDEFIKPRLGKRLYSVFIGVFFLSFIITPISDMKGMFKSGYEEHSIAMDLWKENIVKSSFISNKSYADAGPSIIKVAWFSKNAWYCHPLNNYTTAELLKDAKRYNIKYYFYFYDGSGDDYIFRNSDGKIVEDITNGTINGLKVYPIGE